MVDQLTGILTHYPLKAKKNPWPQELVEKLRHFSLRRRGRAHARQSELERGSAAMGPNRQYVAGAAANRKLVNMYAIGRIEVVPLRYALEQAFQFLGLLAKPF
jgi:hypothetical protein